MFRAVTVTDITPANFRKKIWVLKILTVPLNSPKRNIFSPKFRILGEKKIQQKIFDRLEFSGGRVTPVFSLTLRHRN